MLLEASTFNVFGLKITQDDIERIFQEFSQTYDALRERNAKCETSTSAKRKL